MGLFSRWVTRKKFSDGAVLWPSGKEQFSYLNNVGEQFDFEVLYPSQISGFANLIVASSISNVNGNFVGEEAKREIFSKCIAYFADRGEKASIV